MRNYSERIYHCIKQRKRRNPFTLLHPKKNVGKGTFSPVNYMFFTETPQLPSSIESIHFYRPQRSWAKVIFSQVCLSTGGGRGVILSACWDPPGSRHPPEQTPPEADPPEADTPPGADTPPPGADTPPDQTPPGPDTPQSRHPREQTPPRTRHPPPGSRLQHTVNERPVRILLECILVLCASSCLAACEDLEPT